MINYKAECDTLNNKLNQAYENGYQMEGELHDMTKQRDTLIDDIAVLKANISRLERENRELRNKLEGVETYIEAIEPYSYMYEDAGKRYNTLTDHIRLKAENNPGVSRYIDLVNYIDRLERADDEKI